MEKRPKITIKLSMADTVVELLCFVLLVVLWVYVFYCYGKLSQTIPVHFNFAGKADEFGDKSSIFSLPVIGAIIYVLITFLNRFPHIFNYGAVEITQQNALQQYTNATRMLRYLKLAIVVVFFTIVVYTVNLANGNNNSFGHWLLPIFLPILLAPVIYFSLRMFKKTTN